MWVIGHQESDFQSSFYAFECYKDVPDELYKDCHRQTSKQVVRTHYATTKRGNFLSQEDVGGIGGIKTPLNHAKTEISASKCIIN